MGQSLVFIYGLSIAPWCVPSLTESHFIVIKDVLARSSEKRDRGSQSDGLCEQSVRAWLVEREGVGCWVGGVSSLRGKERLGMARVGGTSQSCF